VKVLRGSAEQRVLDNGHDGLSTYGLLSDHDVRAVRGWVEQLVAQGFLAKTGEYNVLQLTESGRGVLTGEQAPRLLKPARRSGSATRSTRASGSRADSWEGVDRGLFERLRDLRRQLAEEKSVPAYVVFGDASLRDMTRLRPSTLPEFLEVHGVGQKKAADYGELFLAAIGEGA
jgi:ATP-dependent DNA helicase RecQ